MKAAPPSDELVPIVANVGDHVEIYLGNLRVPVKVVKVTRGDSPIASTYVVELIPSKPAFPSWNAKKRRTKRRRLVRRAHAIFLHTPPEK